MNLFWAINVKKKRKLNNWHSKIRIDKGKLTRITYKIAYEISKEWNFETIYPTQNIFNWSWKNEMLCRQM